MAAVRRHVLSLAARPCIPENEVSDRLLPACTPAERIAEAAIHRGVNLLAFTQSRAMLTYVVVQARRAKIGQKVLGVEDQARSRKINVCTLFRRLPGLDSNQQPSG
jgi:hypothetical protein